jgi:peptidoglycan/LPS O-acetylase OafA/YrhL
MLKFPQKPLITFFSHNTLTVQQQNRVFGLDLLRTAAIMFVIYGHGFDPLLSEYFPNLRALIVVDGVDLFFVLSGFLIGSILIKQFENQQKFNLKVIVAFWKRRWLRTLPNYYFVIFVILFVPVILPFLKGNNIAIQPDIWLSFLFFSQNLFTPQVNFFPEAWSLAVEEWFYLLTPIILFIINLITQRYLSKKQILLMLILLVIVIEFLIRFFISKSLDGSTQNWDSNLRRVVFCRLDSIIYGVLGAFIKFYYPNFWTNNKNYFYLFIVGIVGLAMVHFVYLTSINDGANLFMNTLYFSVSSICILLLLPWLDAYKKPPTKTVSGYIGKWITHISLISYSLYLIHGFLILGHIVRYKNEYFSHYIPNTHISGILYFILYFTTSIFIATVMYHFIEKPIMNLRAKELPSAS